MQAKKNSRTKSIIIIRGVSDFSEILDYVQSMNYDFKRLAYKPLIIFV